MVSYINETDFVVENKKLVYPEIVTDGLQLYYDAKGKRDTDYHRDTMLDMSGNKNHGKLHNFAYEKNSGYKDGLVFDYIDDKLVRPALNLKPDDFTYQLNNNILAFTGGEVSTVKNGDVEIGGRNLLKYSNKGFISPWGSWDGSQIENTIGTVGDKVTNIVTINKRDKEDTNAIYRGYSQFEVGKEYTLSFWARINDSAERENGYVKLYINRYVNMSITKEWSLVQVTQEVTSTNNTIHITMDTYDLPVDVALFKLEKGSIATDWTPAPEDLVETTELKGNILGDMENIIDGLYKTEILSGEEIYTDKADDSVVHVEVDGKSVGGGSGKNLWINDSSHWEQGSIASATGSFMDGTTTRIRSKEFIPAKSSQTYTLKNHSSGVQSIVMQWDEDKNYLSSTYWQNQITFKTANNTAYFKYIIAFSAGDTIEAVDAEFLCIQLEEGSVATAYEPPAPTPDYPVEIHSLNDFDVVSSGVGRNYVLSSDFSDGWNNWLNSSGSRGTFVEYDTHPGKKFLRIDNSDGSLSNPFVQSYTSVGEAGKYTLSWLQKGTGNVIIQNASEENGNLTPRVQGIFTGDFSRHSLTLDIEEGNPKARIVFQSFDGHDISVTNVKLEKGNVATDWTPAPEDITEYSNHPLIDKINLLLDEPLRSVEDVKDRLFRDSDGLWKIERNVGETQLGSTDIASISIGSSNNVVTTIKIDNMKYYTSSYGVPFRSTHHGKMKGNPGSSWGTVENRGTATVNTTGSMWLSVDKENVDTIEKARNWFESQKTAGTPVTIQYELETSTTETLPQELQDKLNNLRSFEDSNYVYTVLPNEDNYISENIKPTLHAKFLYNNWYKEDRVINNLMIYNRALTNEEMLQNYKTIKRRWGM